jgi:hypothetical protein
MGRYRLAFTGRDGDLTPMTERRYTDEESTTIFQLAAEGSSTLPDHPSRADGMTLADLTSIGLEVGISPDAVAHAAQTVEVRQGGVSRTLLGLPIGVERRVTLRHRLTDEEWKRLAVQFRDVFKARGRTETDGSLRQWTNGNLYVLLEPTPTGDRLRLGSVNGRATAALRLGLVSLGGAAVVAIGDLLGGHLTDMGAIAGLVAGGLVMLAMGAVRLRGWARLRERQMEDLAAQLALPAGPASLPGSEAV